MRKRSVKPEVLEVSDLNENLFRKRLRLAKTVKSVPFTMIELEDTLKKLMWGKSRDPDSIVCDIFKEEIIGENLKQSLLIIMNKMKDETIVPECIRTANITMLHKKKSKVDLNNWRGIFVTSVIRTI